MRTVVGVTVVFAFLVLPLCSGPTAQPSKIPPCAPWPDDPANYPDNMIRPKYPKDALRHGIAGTVELKAVIAPDGTTKDLVVQSGESEFSQVSIPAVRKWRFHPQVRQGQPVETTYKIRIRFNPMLQEANSDVELESPQPEGPRIVFSSEIRDLGSGEQIPKMSEPEMVAPKAIYAPEPVFSEKARQEREGGVVGISLVVGTDGLPQNLEIGCSSAPDQNATAIEGIKQWRFAPGTKDGKPVAVAIEVEVSFRLK